MILEIFYRGEKIRQTEMPEGVCIEDISYAFRVESKGEAEPDEFTHRKRHPNSTGRKLPFDKRRVLLPEKEPAARFERPKAVYSNPAFF